MKIAHVITRMILGGAQENTLLTCEAIRAGHDVTLITGPVPIDPPEGMKVVDIISVEGLKQALAVHFDRCDALIMAAAVGDFTVAEGRAGKIPRAGGPVQITLLPTEDILAGVTARRRADQMIVGFAVEDSADMDKARSEMTAKNCDYLVLNTPAAMASAESDACILSPDGLALPWARRSKAELAKAIVALLR
ncbi:hypothetical protein LCGC14_1441930 [marine sediment metagenome]|uniref:DNA/pantothenate metabolism flavoprotein C-terminal domain-containing protein n=1 Tax=marine sediment metagenome TaxID=412755 RepID=A0A0F9K6P9_9ZZZZ